MGEEGNDVFFSIHQNQKARYQYITCDDKLDCITTNNVPANITMKNNPSPVKVRQGRDQDE